LRLCACLRCDFLRLFLYARTPNDTSHVSDPHIGPTILTWNRVHPEGSIMEGYTTEEVVECCANYIKDGKRIGLSIPLHEGRLRGRGRMDKKTFVNRYCSLVSETHFSVLQQLTVAEPYINEYLSEQQRDNVGCTYA
jgi:hypothetical protein